MKHYGLILFPVILCMAVVPAAASSTEGIPEMQEETFEIDALERAAERVGSSLEYGQTLDESLTVLFESGKEAAGNVLREAVRSGVLLMTAAVFCALSETLYVSFGNSRVSITSLVGSLSVAAVSVADVDAMIGLGRITVERITEFSNVLLPTVAAITASTGAVTGAAVRQMAAVLFSDVLVNLISKLLIPVLYGYVAVSVAHAATGNNGLSKLGDLLKWFVSTVLTTMMVVFVGYLSVSGVVAGSADVAAVKATKFAISGMIPVVGGILSDAAETVLASAGVLRGTVGVFGTVTILSLCLIPVMKIAIHYLMYKIVAAVSMTVGSGSVGALVECLGRAFGLILGMVGACSLLVLIAIVSSITAVSV